MTEIKMYNVRALSFSFTWGLTEDYSLETSSQIALRNCSKEVTGEVCTYGILEKWVSATSTYPLGRRLLLVTRSKYLG